MTENVVLPPPQALLPHDFDPLCKADNLGLAKQYETEAIAVEEYPEGGKLDCEASK